MGNYSELYVGRVYYAWKNYIPPVVAFLFQDSDFYCDTDHDGCRSLGYATSCRRALAALDTLGFNLSFLSRSYAFFEHRLQEDYRDSVIRAIGKRETGLSEQEIEREADKHLASYPAPTPVEQLRDFTKFVSALVVRRRGKRTCSVTMSDGRKYSVDPSRYRGEHRRLVPVDFDELQASLWSAALDFPPWIHKIGSFFDWEYHTEFPEILILLFLRVLLEASPPGAKVRFELGDILDDEGEARKLRAASSAELVDKIGLYTAMFQNVLREEVMVRSEFVRAECRRLMEQSCREKVASRKGRLFERLTELLFTSSDSLEVVAKNISTGDEEIDLVIKNNVDRPFWLAFGSPLLFVECKNWRKKVGAPEVRNFEIKLQNHSKLVRIGILFAANGFTDQAFEEVKRAGREKYHLVLLSGHELERFLDSHLPFFDWLESQTAIFH